MEVNDCCAVTFQGRNKTSHYKNSNLTRSVYHVSFVPPTQHPSLHLCFRSPRGTPSFSQWDKQHNTAYFEVVNGIHLFQTLVNLDVHSALQIRRITFSQSHNSVEKKLMEKHAPENEFELAVTFSLCLLIASAGHWPEALVSLSLILVSACLTRSLTVASAYCYPKQPAGCEPSLTLVFASG